MWTRTLSHSAVTEVQLDRGQSLMSPPVSPAGWIYVLKYLVRRDRGGSSVPSSACDVD